MKRLITTLLVLICAISLVQSQVKEYNGFNKGSFSFEHVNIASFDSRPSFDVFHPDIHYFKLDIDSCVYLTEDKIIKLFVKPADSSLDPTYLTFVLDGKIKDSSRWDQLAYKLISKDGSTSYVTDTPLFICISTPVLNVIISHKKLKEVMFMYETRKPKY